MTDSGYHIQPGECGRLHRWIALLGIAERARCTVRSYRQGWGMLRTGRNIIGETLRLGAVEYRRGYGTHADGEIVLASTRPVRTFSAVVGVDANRNSRASAAVLRFAVEAAGVTLFETGDLCLADGGMPIAVDLHGATEFILRCRTLNTASLAHASWCDPTAVCGDGTVLELGGADAPLDSGPLPLDFLYGEETAEVWFDRVGIQAERQETEEYVRHLFTARDPADGFTVVAGIREYRDFPAAWLELEIANAGGGNSKPLRQVRPFAAKWLFPGNIKRLHRANGSFDYFEDGEAVSGEAYRDCFLLREDNLVKGPSRLSATGGRSSVQDMPYFNFQGEEGGLVVGVGWTGQWAAEVAASGDVVRFSSELPELDAYLLPGETLRLPSTLLIHYLGASPLRGHNLLRRFLQERVLPRYGGKPVQAPVCCPGWGGLPQAWHMERIGRLAREKLDYDYYWIDAGWYGTGGTSPNEFTPNWSCQAGDWRVDPSIYPDGMKAVADCAHDHGFKFLLWGEPERAVQGRGPTVEHPEWFIGRSPRRDGDGVLTDYAVPQAVDWAAAAFGELIAATGIDCYRQDFNVFPLEWWRLADAEGRRGMTEVRYINGLYRFLAELRRRFPQLLIDNCAGGGRRLDLEMMRYSIPLWASDMQCYSDCTAERNLQHLQGLAYWLPQFALGTQDNPGNTCHFRSVLAAGMTFHCFDDGERAYPYDWHRERLAEYHRFKHFFSGDFYPLLEISTSFKSWAAYQFDRPDLDEGIALFFRKRESPFEEAVFELSGLDPDREYRVTEVDSGLETAYRGTLPVLLETPSSSRICHYRAGRTSS